MTQEPGAANQRLVTVCAWCLRLRDRTGAWHGGSVPWTDMPTHGICPECVQRLLRPEPPPSG